MTIFMYCKYCGKTYDYKAYVCSHCQHDYSKEGINKYLGERTVYKASGLAFLSVLIVTFILQLMQPFQDLIDFLNDVPVLNILPNLISIIFGILAFILTFVTYGLFTWSFIAALYNKKQGRNVNFLYLLAPVVGMGISEISLYSSELLFSHIFDPIYNVLYKLVEADYSLSLRLQSVYIYFNGLKLVATDIICLIIFLIYGLYCFGAYALNKTLSDNVDLGNGLSQSICGIKLFLSENKNTIVTATDVVNKAVIKNTINSQKVKSVDGNAHYDGTSMGLVKAVIKNTTNSQKVDSYYDGTAMGLFKAMLGPTLLSLITLGICVPFLLEATMRYQYNHTIISGRRLNYTGTGKTFFGKYIKWCLLSILTLGIYSITIPKKLMDYQAAHLFFEDDGATLGNTNSDSCYTGTTGETFLDLFIGFLFMTFTFQLLLYGGTHYYQQKVRDRLVISGVSLKNDSNWSSHIGKYVVDALLTSVTLGIWSYKGTTNLLKNVCAGWYICEDVSMQIEAIEEPVVHKENKDKVDKKEVQEVIEDDEEEIDLGFDEEEIDLDFDDSEEEIDLGFADDSDFEDVSNVEVNEEEEKRKAEALKKVKRKQVVNDDEYDMVPVNRNSKIKQGKRCISRVHNVLEDEEDLDIDEDVSNVESELKPTIKVSKIGRHMKS